MSRARDTGVQQHWFAPPVVEASALPAKARRMARLYRVQQVVHCHERGRACQSRCELVQPPS